MKPTWTITAIAVAGAALIWWLAREYSSATPVETAAVTHGPIREFVDERAKTRLPQTHLITMPFPGRIEAIGLAEGTPVEKGKVVATLVPRDLELAVQQAQAAVERLDASIKENGDVSVEETGYKQTIQFVESMKAAVQAAEARLRSGRAKFGSIRRASPRPVRWASSNNG